MIAFLFRSLRCSRRNHTRQEQAEAVLRDFYAARYAPLFLNTDDSQEASPKEEEERRQRLRQDFCPKPAELGGVVSRYIPQYALYHISRVWSLVSAGRWWSALARNSPSARSNWRTTS